MGAVRAFDEDGTLGGWLDRRGGLRGLDDFTFIGPFSKATDRLDSFHIPLSVLLEQVPLFLFLLAVVISFLSNHSATMVLVPWTARVIETWQNLNHCWINKLL